MQNYTDWLRQQQAVVCLLERMPRRPRATDDFERYGVKQMSKAAALGKRYIQINGNRLAGYLALDLDHEGAAYSWERAGLPPPSIITISPSSRCHYLYQLSSPVAITEAARPGPARFLEDIRKRYVDALDADPLFSGQVSKNPLHPDWRVVVTNRRYQLGEMKEAVPDRKKKARQPARDLQDSRNCFLFDVVRVWAYRHVHEFQDFDSFLGAIMWRCESEWNAFSVPLPLGELVSISKSVSRWVWPRRENFSADGERRLVSRQTIEKVTCAAERLGRAYRLGAAGMFKHYLSQVAREAGVSRDTAERVQKEIMSTTGS